MRVWKHGVLGMGLCFLQYTKVEKVVPDYRVSHDSTAGDGGDGGDGGASGDGGDGGEAMLIDHASLILQPPPLPPFPSPPSS